MNSQIETVSCSSDYDESNVAIFLWSVWQTTIENDEYIRTCDVLHSVRHMEYENQSGWIDGAPKKDYMIKFLVETNQSAYTIAE